MEEYWVHNTKARLHEWFDRHFRKSHYCRTIEDSIQSDVDAFTRNREWLKKEIK